MKICVLDGEKIKDKKQLHDVLAEALNLPAWYGRNLDALYDCLTDIREELQIQLLQVPVLEKNLGRYAELLLKVLCAASRENNAIHIKTDGEKDE